MKKQLINEMESKVNAMMEVKSKLKGKVAEFNDAQADDAKTIEKMKETQQTIEDEKLSATDVEDARKAHDKLNKVNEEIALQQGVTKAKAQQRYNEIEEFIQTLLNHQTECKRYYQGELEYNAKTTACLQTVDKDTDILANYANKIDGVLSYSKSILLEVGIIDMSVHSYNEVHLDRMPLHTDLEGLFGRFVIHDYRAGHM